MTTEASPEHAELIERAIASRLEAVNVCEPGIVVDYDPAKRTATVQPAVNLATLDTDGEITEETIPPIPNVPVQWPRSQNFSITATLAAGDTVLLVYNTRSPTGWRSTGEISTPQDLRLHGRYPVAIPGYCPDTVANPDTDDSIGRPGGLRIHFTEHTINVGAGAQSLPTAAGVDAELTKVQAAISGLGGAYARVPVVASTNLKVD